MILHNVQIGAQYYGRNIVALKKNTTGKLRVTTNYVNNVWFT